MSPTLQDIIQALKRHRYPVDWQPIADWALWLHEAWHQETPPRRPYTLPRTYQMLAREGLLHG